MMEDIEQKIRNAKLEELLKLLKKEYELREDRVEKIKEMIEKGEYEVPIEEVVEKILKFLKENR